MQRTYKRNRATDGNFNIFFVSIPTMRDCSVCGKSFVPKSWNANVCSLDCKKVKNRAREKTRTRDKVAQGKYMKKYYQKHKLERKEWRDNYYKKNKKSILEHNKIYRDVHSEEIRVRARDLYEKNIEDRRATRRAYRQNNREKINQQQRDQSKTPEYRQKRRIYLRKQKFDIFREVNESVLGHPITCNCQKKIICNGYTEKNSKHPCPHNINAKNWEDPMLDLLTLGHPNRDGAAERARLNKGKKRVGSGWTGYAQIKKAGYPGIYAVQCRNCNRE